jgi:hypothetical protein
MLAAERPFDEIQPIAHPAQVLPEVETVARVQRLEVAGLNGFHQIVETFLQIP